MTSKNADDSSRGLSITEMAKAIARRHSGARRQRRQREEGFTLIELVIVLVVIAILVAIAVPQVDRWIGAANDVAENANERIEDARDNFNEQFGPD